tara:strand:- start:75 stop:791 length:717 start_codon:yes stop_codon:yes gene_type:complete
MGYTKQYTYVNDTVLSADNHASNEKALKEYVNQEIVSSDVGTDTIVGESIATPRLITSVQTADFVSKTLQGVAKIRLPQEYSWFTSTTKSGNQVSTTVQDYQPLANTGAEVVIVKDNTKIMITFYAKAFGATNSTATKAPGQNLWDNEFLLQYEKNGLITRLAGTRSYVFENDTTGSSSPLPPIDAGANGNQAGHRSIMMTRMLTLSTGRYKFSVAVNAKVEKGNINCQTFTIETFHV